MPASDVSPAPPRASLMRRVLVVLGAACLGALLGAAAFLAVLHDPMGMPQPTTPLPDTAGWGVLFNVGFGLFGAAVGGLVGAVVGVGILLWRSWQRRAG